MVTLRLLGGINLTESSGEELLPLLSQPKRMAVLAYLALEGRGGYVRRDVLTALFWAESDTSHARNALNQVLHSLRKELGGGVLRTRGKHDVGLDPGRFHCDAWSFRDALEERRYEAALGLYGGPLLPGFHVDGGGWFERWLEEERERLREAASGASWSLAHEFIREGALVEAERTAQKALALVWTDETPVREFITALADAGDRAAAIRFYEKFCSRLREDLDLEPSAPTVRVADAIRNGVGGGSWIPVGEQDPAPGARPSEGSRTREDDLEGGWVASAEPGQVAAKGEDGGPSPPGSVALPELHPVHPPARRERTAWFGGWWWAGGAVTAGLILFTIPGLRRSPVFGPPPADRPFTVLADVEGSSDEEEREAVAFLLRTGLDASHVVQTVPAPDVARTLALMDREHGTRLDAAAARLVGARLGVPTVVIPRLDRLGESYSLALRVEEAASGRFSVGAQGQAADVTGVVSLVDSLVLELRRTLGEAKEVLAQRQPLPQVLTPSLEALRKYEAARSLNASAEPQAAVSLLREAVALDTAFAMAWNLMAAVYGNYLDRPDSAAFASERVKRFPERLTDARRRDGELHRRMQNDVALWDLALEEADRAVRRDPDYLNNYAVYLAFEAGLPDSAVDIRFTVERRRAERARRFDDSAPLSTYCWINTHYWANAADRTHEWLALLDSLGIELPVDCGREVALFERLAAGEWDRAEEMLRPDPGDWRWPDAVETASRQLDPLRGRIFAAHRMPPPVNAEKKTWARGQWSNVSNLLLEVAYGVPPEEPSEGRAGGMEGQRRLEGRGRDVVVDFVLHGVREALLGDTVEALRVARHLQAMRDSATSRTFEGAFAPWFVLLEAGPAFQRGDWPVVMETLGPMATRVLEPGVGFLAGDAYLVWWLMASAHQEVGQPASAIPYLESILRRPTHGIQDWTLQGYIHPAARFKLAGLYADVGNPGKAREHYRIFLDTFTDPDPDFRWMVEEARLGLDQAEG